MLFVEKLIYSKWQLNYISRDYEKCFVLKRYNYMVLYVFKIRKNCLCVKYVYIDSKVLYFKFVNIFKLFNIIFFYIYFEQ